MGIADLHSNCKKHLIILLILLISCKEKQEIDNMHIINYSDREKTHLNWKHPTKFICLDKDSDSALFAEINKVIIKNDHIYILDVQGKKSVLCFDFKGNFIRSYGQTGRGPGEHTRLSDFDVKLNGDVYLYCRTSKKVIHLHENGGVISEYKFDFRANGFKLLKDGEYFFSLANVNKHNHQFYIYNPITIETKNIFNFDKRDKTNRSINSYTQAIAAGFVSYLPVRDEFIIFNESGDLQEVFKFDFGRYTLPQKSKFDALTWGNIEGHFYYLDATPIKTGNYIIGEFNSFTKRCIFVYNIQKRELFVDNIDINNYSHKNLHPYLGVYNDYIVSALDNAVYEASNEKESLPQNVIEHIKSGGFVLTLSTLMEPPE